MIISFLLFVARANAVDLSRELLAAQLAQDAVEKVQSISAPVGQCASPIINAVRFADLLKRRSEVKMKDAHENVQTLSLLTQKEAIELQAYVNADEALAAKFTEDGCEQRAIETVRVLRGQGVRAGIIGAFPGGAQDSGRFTADFPGAVPGTLWRQHFATTIAVSENGHTTLKVVDPLFSRTPLTKVQWLQKLQARSTTDEPVDSYLNSDQSYSEEAVEKANAQLRLYRETQKKRDELLGR